MRRNLNKEGGSTPQGRANALRIASLARYSPCAPPPGLQSQGRAQGIARVRRLGELEPACGVCCELQDLRGWPACSQGAYARGEPLGFLVLRQPRGSEQCRGMNRRAGRNGQAKARQRPPFETLRGVDARSA